MRDPRAPHIVRPANYPAGRSAYVAKPGVHSHNLNRRKRQRAQGGWLSGVRLLLLLVGLVGVSYYGYTLCDQYIYQSFQNWAFDQQIAGRARVNFGDYVREHTPFGFLAGAPSSAAGKTATAQAQALARQQAARPAAGSVLGRVNIARLNLAAMVREGVAANVLKVAVGHVPSTALPGQPGNFAIAAHRDTLFRALKDIRLGDLVSLQSATGTYTYKVVATKIVRPSDVSVLQPNGGGLIPQARLVSNAGQPEKLLTMITCYPFYYVGSAPKRFVVEAELVSSTNSKNPASSEMSSVVYTPGRAEAQSVRPSAPHIS